MENTNENNGLVAETQNSAENKKVCPSCGASNPLYSKFCAKCGTSMIAEAQPTAEVQPVAEAQPVEESQSAAEAQSATEGQPTVETQPEQSGGAEPKKQVKKKKNKKIVKIIAIAVAAVIFITGIGVGVWFLGADGRTISEAEKYMDIGDYAKAYELLSQVSDPAKTDITMKKLYKLITDDIEDEIADGGYTEAKEIIDRYPNLTDREQILKKWTNAITEKIYSLISEGDYVGAQEMLEQYSSDLTDREQILKKWINAVTEKIYALMSDGDYVGAQEMLEQYRADITGSNRIAKQIKYEQLALTGLLDLKKLYKNPSSMQVTNVEFYESDDNYPFMLTKASGQNGFGGYASSYNCYSSDTMLFVGSTDTMSYSEADDDYEILIIYCIEMVRELPKCDFEVDIQRLNSVLQSGKTPKLNIEQYKQGDKGTV